MKRNGSLPRSASLAAVFHALTIGTYLSIQQYVANMSVAPPSALAIPLGLSLGGTLVLLVATRLVLRSWTASGVAVSCFFFGLAPLPSVESAVVAVLPPAAHSVGELGAASVYSLAVAAVALWVAKQMTEHTLRAARDGLNLMAVALLALNLVGVAKQQRSESWPLAVAELAAAAERPVRQTDEGPDIYYIILDGYARDDVLSERFGVARNTLTDYLASKDFYVAARSRANCSQTYLSLASSLNMTYLDPLAAVMQDSPDRRPLGHLIEHNAVMSELRARGYTTVLVSSDYYATDGMSDVDHCLCEVFRPTEFSALWFSRTPLGAIPSVSRAPYEAHRNKVRRAFELLRQPPPGDAPHFVFAHLIAPHPPFVFRESGQPTQPLRPFSFHDGSHFRGSTDEYRDGYRAQLAFINTQLQMVIESITARTHGEAVIIVQSDHGPGSALRWESAEMTDMKERTGILSAYYLPGRDTAALYPSMSPVNTFRVIFNEYLGASYDLLPDRSYFSTWSRPYRFVEVAAATSSHASRHTEGQLATHVRQ